MLLQQTPRSVDEFAEVLPILAAERRVVAMDTPGYRCSDRVPGRPTVADYAAVARDVLDAHGIERVIVVGHHTGAVVPVEMAALQGRSFREPGACGAAQGCVQAGARGVLMRPCRPR